MLLHCFRRVCIEIYEQQVWRKPEVFYARLIVAHLCLTHSIDLHRKVSGSAMRSFTVSLHEKIYVFLSNMSFPIEHYRTALHIALNGENVLAYVTHFSTVFFLLLAEAIIQI